MMYFIDDFSGGIEITYGRSLFTPQSWQSYFNYPEIGLGFYHGTFGNKDIYGTGYALFPYINYNIYRNPKLSVQNKVSMGLGYATKPFDIETNTYNTVFSSHLNVYIGLALLMDYRIHKNFSLSASASLTHLSNGAYRKPNHGVNTLTASLGAKYHFNDALTPVLPKEVAPPSNKREVLIVGSIGRSQSTPYNQQLYWNGSLSINHLWHINEKRAVGLGFDQFYSETAPYSWEAYEKAGEDVTFSTQDYLFNAVFASYNVFLGKTTLFVNVGTYLHTNIKPPQPVYPRLGIRHYVTKNLIANFSVKASFFRSEFLEFGLGYSFRYNKKNKA
ncbi:acyloxyacyl hydrolase [Carboxylicivirga mesophila]|uniref:Acyloxyacyl hydrolase n=1 Tax=Carboxylicivirga mesophila TaxID=1166478 RepID=A0ABS5K6T6_9BACT|nr:acyloxyacyl hydrolase [Carboxylicivirga mesophila]MBS2210226.1 acyloxyacyl hydrolase [Carboxylicivirga mesophila]